ncbi:HEPN domain-containing protein [Candidatus Bathyarchaeota archaeon]|nr:HEPN domain-containing protein [Candidatus Bathyarchaeota archaeon]
MSSIEANILLVKAERKLKHAERGFEEEDYDSTVGDSYRCIELCMRSLLLAHGFNMIPKTHGGLLQAFSKEIVLKGIFPKDVAKEISGIISLRARADYAALFVSREEAVKALEICRKIFQITKQVISKKLQ